MISNGAMKSNRVGLSEYTARRLSELQARRVEADNAARISLGATSSSSTAAAAAEAAVNDSENSTVAPVITTQLPAKPTVYNKSTADISTAAHVVASTGTKLPSNSDVSSSSNLPKTTGPGISAQTTNGISEGSPDTDDTSATQKQSWNNKSESSSSTVQRKVDRQDLSYTRAAAELGKPPPPPVQRREIPQPSPFMRTGSNSTDDTAFSRSTAEVGTSRRTVSFFTCVSYAEARNRYRLDVRPSVCPSVRPSHAGTVSKRLNILSCFLRHTIAHSF